MFKILSDHRVYAFFMVLWWIKSLCVWWKIEYPVFHTTWTYCLHISKWITISTSWVYCSWSLTLGWHFAIPYTIYASPTTATGINWLNQPVSEHVISVYCLSDFPLDGEVKNLIDFLVSFKKEQWLLMIQIWGEGGFAHFKKELKLLAAPPSKLVPYPIYSYYIQAYVVKSIYYHNMVQRPVKHMQWPVRSGGLDCVRLPKELKTHFYYSTAWLGLLMSQWPFVYRKVNWFKPLLLEAFYEEILDEQEKPVYDAIMSKIPVSGKMVYFLYFFILLFHIIIYNSVIVGQ